MDEKNDYLAEAFQEHQQSKELLENKDWDGLERFSRSLLKKYKLRKIELEEAIPLLKDRINREFFPLKPEYGKQHYEQKLWEMKDELTFVKKQIVSLEDEIKSADDLKKREKELWDLKLLQLKLKSESRKNLGENDEMIFYRKYLEIKEELKGKVYPFRGKAFIKALNELTDCKPEDKFTRLAKFIDLDDKFKNSINVFKEQSTDKITDPEYIREENINLQELDKFEKRAKDHIEQKVTR